MSFDPLAEAIALLEKANADLEPELLDASAARHRLALHARAKNLAAFGETALTRKVADVGEIARVTGTSVPRARATAEAAVALRDADTTRDAFASGGLSFDQASEIARAERAKPEVARELLETARSESFQVLRARRVVLEAEQACGLGERQRRARSAGCARTSSG